jgi:hypothetical protein
MDLQERDKIQLALDRIQWRTLASTVPMKGVTFLDQLSNYQLTNDGSVPWSHLISEFVSYVGIRMKGITENLVRWIDRVSKEYQSNINRARYRSATLFDSR